MIKILHYSIMVIHKSIRDITDITNSIMVIYNLVMDIHNSVMVIYNLVPSVCWCW